MVRNILLIFAVKLKDLVTGKASLAIMFVLPLFFVYLVGGIYGGQRDNVVGKNAIVDEDHSTISRQLITKLEQRTETYFYEIKDRATAIRALKQLDCQNIYVITPGFGKTVIAGRIPHMDKYASYGKTSINSSILVLSETYRLMLSGKAFGAVDYELNLRRYPDAGRWRRTAVRADIAYRYGQYLNSRSRIFTVDFHNVYFGSTSKHPERNFGFTGGPMGMILTFMALFTGYGMTFIYREKETGTWVRMKMICGILPYAVGSLLAIFFAAMFQSTVLVIIAVRFLGTGIKSGAFELLLVFAPFFVLMLAIVAVVAVFSENAAGMFSNFSLFVLFMSLIGGCFWPLEILPVSLQKMTLATPQGLAVSSFNALELGDYRAVLMYGGCMLVAAGLIFAAVLCKLRKTA